MTTTASSGTVEKKNWAGLFGTNIHHKFQTSEERKAQIAKAKRREEARERKRLADIAEQERKRDDEIRQKQQQELVERLMQMRVETPSHTIDIRKPQKQK